MDGKQLSRLDRRGFTLTEMMMALLISIIVFFALVELASDAIRSQTAGLRQDRAQVAVVIAARHITADVSAANFIKQPTQSSSANNVLEGYIGRACVKGCASGAPQWLNAMTGDTTGNYTWFYYCVDTSQTLSRPLYRYTATFPLLTDPPAAPPCGSPLGTIQAEQMLGFPLYAAKNSNAYFSRPSGAANIVQVVANVTRPATVGSAGSSTVPLDLDLVTQQAASPP